MLHRTVRLGPTAPPVAGGPFAPRGALAPPLVCPQRALPRPWLTAMSFRKAEIAAILTQLGGTGVAPVARRGPRGGPDPHVCMSCVAFARSGDGCCVGDAQGTAGLRVHGRMLQEHNPLLGMERRRDFRWTLHAPPMHIRSWNCSRPCSSRRRCGRGVRQLSLRAVCQPAQTPPARWQPAAPLAAAALPWLPLLGGPGASRTAGLFRCVFKHAFGSWRVAPSRSSPS